MRLTIISTPRQGTPYSSYTPELPVFASRLCNSGKLPAVSFIKPLGIEKVIPAGGKARFRVRPLKPGRYAFVGEYHEATTKGVVVVE